MLAFLRSERATAALLLVAVVGLFLLTPLADMGIIHSRTPEYAFWMFLVLGVAVITHHPLVRWVGVLLALGAVAADQMKGFHASLTEALCTLGYCQLLLWVLWQRVFAPGRVTANKLVGAVTIYILLGVIWSQVYAIIELLVPGSFRFGSEFGGMPVESNLMYFSFITLTTVGYGDATPVMPMAHAMAVLEALVGQLYLAILIGRLVSNLQLPTENDSE